MNYRPGLTFFDFFRHEAFGWDNPGSVEWCDRFFNHVFVDVFKKAGHNGDCTKQAHTCDLCLVEDMLREYSQYRFRYDEWLKETTGE